MMEVEHLIEVFEQTGHGKFEDIEHKLSDRKDLHAFLLLDQLVKSKRCIVGAVEHDILYLEPTLEQLAAVATKDQLKDLIRCGVMIEDDSLAMFV